eukprot:m.197384 g.197384  ORF g.197384 m.197384 type:complete len:1063 (-) comp16825_c0_seq4:501-3689(-)
MHPSDPLSSWSADDVFHWIAQELNLSAVADQLRQQQIDGQQLIGICDDRRLANDFSIQSRLERFILIRSVQQKLEMEQQSISAIEVPTIPQLPVPVMDGPSTLITDDPYTGLPWSLDKHVQACSFYMPTLTAAKARRLLHRHGLPANFILHSLQATCEDGLQDDLNSNCHSQPSAWILHMTLRPLDHQPIQRSFSSSHSSLDSHSSRYTEDTGDSCDESMRSLILRPDSFQQSVRRSRRRICHSSKEDDLTESNANQHSEMELVHKTILLTDQAAVVGDLRFPCVSHLVTYFCLNNPDAPFALSVEDEEDISNLPHLARPWMLVQPSEHDLVRVLRNARVPLGTFFVCLHPDRRPLRLCYKHRTYESTECNIEITLDYGYRLVGDPGAPTFATLVALCDYYHNPAVISSSCPLAIALDETAVMQSAVSQRATPVQALSGRSSSQTRSMTPGRLSSRCATPLGSIAPSSTTSSRHSSVPNLHQQTESLLEKEAMQRRLTVGSSTQDLTTAPSDFGASNANASVYGQWFKVGCSSGACAQYLHEHKIRMGAFVLGGVPTISESSKGTSIDLSLYYFHDGRILKLAIVCMSRLDPTPHEVIWMPEFSDSIFSTLHELLTFLADPKKTPLPIALDYNEEENPRYEEWLKLSFTRAYALELLAARPQQICVLRTSTTYTDRLVMTYRTRENLIRHRLVQIIQPELWSVSGRPSKPLFYLGEEAAASESLLVLVDHFVEYLERQLDRRPVFVQSGLTQEPQEPQQPSSRLATFRSQDHATLQGQAQQQPLHYPPSYRRRSLPSPAFPPSFTSQLPMSTTSIHQSNLAPRSHPLLRRSDAENNQLLPPPSAVSIVSHPSSTFIHSGRTHPTSGNVFDFADGRIHRPQPVKRHILQARSQASIQHHPRRQSEPDYPRTTQPRFHARMGSILQHPSAPLTRPHTLTALPLATSAATLRRNSGWGRANQQAQATFTQKVPPPLGMQKTSVNQAGSRNGTFSLTKQHQDSYLLTVSFQGALITRQIRQTPHGFYLRGSKRPMQFPSLNSLLDFYMFPSTDLPCPLVRSLPVQA